MGRLSAGPAGQTAAGVHGLHDMGANVWDWVSDAQGNSQMRADMVAWKPAGFHAVYTGFRCAHG